MLARLTVLLTVMLTLLSGNFGDIYCQEHQNIEMIGSALFQLGESFDVEVDDGFAFLAASHSGLIIFDVADPEEPLIVGNYPWNPESSNDVMVTGRIAYVADRWGGMLIIDIDDVQHPQLIGSIDTPGDAKGIYISGDYAYVADGRDSGVVIVDIGNPEDPRIVGSYNTPGDAYKTLFDPQEDILYVADGRAGLLAIDVSNPRAPRQVGILNTPGWVYDFEIDGDYMHIADGTRGYKLIDIGDPRGMRIVSELETSEAAEDLTVSGNYAFVADRDGGLFVIDIANRNNPRRAAIENIPGEAQGIAYDDGFAYLACYRNGLQIVDVSNPRDPVHASEYSTPGRWARNTCIEDDLCFLANSSGGVTLFDISDPEEPDSVNSIDTEGLAFDVDYIDGYIYVAVSNSGIKIYDVADPDDPQFIRSMDASYALCSEIRGDYLYTADGRDGGIRIMDISDRENPDLVRSIATAGDANWLAASEELLVLADGSEGMRVYDIDNPENPTLRDVYNPDGNSLTGIDINDDIVCTVSYEGNLRIIDVSNPANPISRDVTNLGPFLRAITIEDDHAYIGASSGGLFVVDISDPRNSEVVGFFDTPGYAYCPSVDRGTVYLGEGTQLSVYRFLGLEEPLPEGIFINEVMPDNRHIIADNEDDFDPWLELYNSNDFDVNLSGLFLSSAEDEPDMWEFPDGSLIESESQLLIWADGDDNGRGIHADLQLLTEDGYASLKGLIAGEFETVDETSWEETPQDWSNARIEDGAEHWQTHFASTPGYSNTETGLRYLTVEFPDVWNMISINIAPGEEFYRIDNGPDIVRMMDQLVFEEEEDLLILLKDGSGRFYSPQWDFCNIPFWDLTKGYSVKVNEACRAGWTGEVLPANMDIPMHTGWDIWGYMPTYELDASAPDYYVLSNIIDVVEIAKDGYGRFLSPQWNFSNIPPWHETQGYLIRISQEAENVVLNYPPPEENILQSIVPNEPLLTPPATDQNMSVLVQLNNVSNPNGKTVNAFDCDGALVGSGELQSDGRAGIAVWGDDTSTDGKEGLIETESFQLYLTDNKSESKQPIKIDRILAGEGLTYKRDDLIVLDAQVAGTSLPMNLELLNCYPNPFNSTVKIKYNIEEFSRVSINLYDQNGKLINQVISSNIDSGNHTSLYDASHLPAGIYFVKFVVNGNLKAVKKVGIMK